MNIYLVRHGESEANAQQVKQGTDGNLSAKGKQQATFLAERLSHIQLENIISSPVLRAQQTADIINKKLNLPLTNSPLFVERKTPTELIGKPLQSPEVTNAMQKMYDNYTDNDWHYSDEENFSDLKTRAINGLKELSKSSSKNRLVVTHGAFLRVLIACVIMGNMLTSAEYLKFNSTLKATNTGITLIRYIDNEWQLIIWNDHS
ncbi:MAG: histidine phosphatase family protein, partial [Candidatus Jacksonbacteria bacterium]|nr:histidine phosphatase family protein [Candidatus Jacksonbacteria bacterium]